jgi:hypothetical protein
MHPELPVTVMVVEGDPIPECKLGALKELIKKVAPRKIRQMEEELTNKPA